MHTNPKMKRTAFIIFFLIAVLSISAWLFNHSYIEFTINNKSNGDISITLVSDSMQKSQETHIIRTNVYKKLVKRGRYEIRATQANKSYLTTLKVGSIFSKARASGSLVDESSREFIGDNPGLCMLYGDDVLVSNACGGQYDSIKTHIPATTAIPTYTLRDTGSLKATTEGFISTPQGSFLLVLQPISEDDTLRHVLYKLTPVEGGPDRATRVLDLTTLDRNKTYGIQAYRTGFIAYSADLDDIEYYENTNAFPVRIKQGELKNKKLMGISLNASQYGTAVLYSNITEGEKIKPSSIKSEVAVIKSDSKHFSFNHSYSEAYICGEELLCALNGSKLDIYKLKDTKAKLVYSIYDVRNTIVQDQNNIIILTKSGLATYNLDKNMGSYLISSGSTSLNSIAPSGKNILLNSTLFHDKKVALLIKPTVRDTNNIDKKVYELQKTPELSAVSVYRNSIFVTPELGDPVYDDTLGLFVNNQTTKNKANSKINETIKKLGIPSTFTIVNTLP